ncbi:MAG: hypothetical protein J5824_02395 [Lachnospiraceae bacterium]|nr:hypothetical protein [Lachnospiraceae bacterium]
MYVLKIDFPTGIAYFTGKKKVVQGTESPGLTDTIDDARHFETEEEAAKFCKMLIKKYDMEFYYTDLAAAQAGDNPDEDVDFLVNLGEELSDEIAREFKNPDEDD